MKFGVFALLLLIPALLPAQGTKADYDRANALRTKLANSTVDVPGPVTWLEGDRFYYRKSVKGGNVFVLVDAVSGKRQPAFDHERLAAALATVEKVKYTAITLPLMAFEFTDGEKAILFTAAGSLWKCTLTDYACSKSGTAPAGAAAGRGGRGPYVDESLESPAPAEFENDVVDGMVQEPSPQQGQGRGGRGQTQAQPTPPLLGIARVHTALPGYTPFDPPPDPAVRTSPDDKWEALILNYNVFLRAKGQTEAKPLSYDGSEGNYYTIQSVVWSPDAKHLVAYRTTPGYQREVHYVESSPTDQLQPKHSSRIYAKPGDTIDVSHPVLFNVAEKKQIAVDNALFPNPYSLSPAKWWKDGRGFTFEYNERGHQVYRVVEVDTRGKSRALITEEAKTFIDYRPLITNPRDTGKKARFDLNDGHEIVWASERDGWEHLYLYDGVTGKLKNQITKGNWVVRSVDKVDEERRHVWFTASGMNAGEDPYFVHQYRINLDGTNLVSYTPAAADHTIAFSADYKYYVDTYSRADQPTVSELYRTEDRKKLVDLEHGDATPALDAGWKMPEVFSAKGRDGKTDIWGVIYKPSNFDPAKKYPVIENIYNGPQGSFVPKSFSVTPQPLAELGFIVVQIDGMGTNNRSRAFHDVAYQNLGDAGFPDRIAWHKAVAAQYPWYDITRVGIYGTSAGGQNSLGALLFHPEFYKAAVSNSGCHDNRMDKIWWNEQWMGWPLGPQYAESSNVDNAYRLQGDLLLVLGELDTNVDPASTLQVVNQLIKHNKKFDLLFVPGGGHGAGGLYGQHLLQDFFVHHLLKVEPPEWSREG
jgi:dipeptidyl aminopeptidase/acylaminoacyl peptidase